MLRNRAVQASLALAVAVVCIPGAAMPAADSGGDVAGLPGGHQECCPGAAPGQGIALLPAPAGDLAGFRALRLAQETADEGSAEEGAAADDAEDRQRSGQAPGDEAASAGDAFRGSAKPAGPDLSTTEERELISRGWD